MGVETGLRSIAVRLPIGLCDANKELETSLHLSSKCVFRSKTTESGTWLHTVRTSELKHTH